MKGIRFLAAIAACLMVAVAMADDTDEAKKKINSIKKNSSYLYAEVTAATADEARSLAEEILYAEINEWAAGLKKLRNSPGLAVNNKQALWTTMSLPRGNMVRSFIYVKKSDILPVANSEVMANPAASPSANGRRTTVLARRCNATDRRPFRMPSCWLSSSGRATRTKLPWS